ncbi:MAG: PDZ domain-containing protein [Pseudomonadota bacterium]
MNPLLFLLLPAALAGPAHEDAIVQLKVTHQRWERSQPWSKTNPSLRTSQAVVVEGLPGQGPALLTTAQMVDDAAHVRVSKHGQPEETSARVYFADREANLALVVVDDPAFFADLHPVKLAKKPLVSGEVVIARWRDNQIETSVGRVARGTTVDSRTGVLRSAGVRIQADIGGGGWAEPIFAGGALAGLATGASGSELAVMPWSFFGPWLEELRRTGGVRPWPGRLGIDFEAIRDPAIAGWLGLDSPHGVLVTRVAQGSSACGVLRRGDVLLALDGQAVDGGGNIRDADFGLLEYEVLLSRHHAGESVPVRVLREGTEQDLTMPLRSYTGASWLVPSDRTDPPAYLMAGGLVFRELDDDYGGGSPELDIINQLWREAQTADERRVVVLADVLADPYNLGYHGLDDLPVATVNGVVVDRVGDVAEALQHPEGGFHVIRLRPNPTLMEIVLDAATLDEATARIAAAYGVPAPYRPEVEPPDLGEACGE